MSKAIERLCALAQETRLEAFRQLVVAGPAGLAAGDLADRLCVAPGTLSFHLKELTHANLVRPNRQGRQIFYAANFAAMNDLCTYLMQDCCQGQSDFCLPPIAADTQHTPEFAKGETP